jgi:nucleoid-associated protein YgaU
MANAVPGGSGGGVVTGKKYNPYTGKWEDVYGPVPKSGSNGKKVTPKKSPSSSKPKSPPKPATPDKGNAHKGSGEDNKEETIERVREIEYDLEGSATINPVPGLTARQMISFQGMGINFSGKYFIASVTHTINRSGYGMSIEVLRNNFVWKVSPVKNPSPKVPPKKEPKKSGRTYTVRKGDTLWAIAKRFYGKGSQYMKIVNANRGKIKDPHWIYPRQVFLIP